MQVNHFWKLCVPSCEVSDSDKINSSTLPAYNDEARILKNSSRERLGRQPFITYIQIYSTRGDLLDSFLIVAFHLRRTHLHPAHNIWGRYRALLAVQVVRAVRGFLVVLTVQLVLVHQVALEVRAVQLAHCAQAVRLVREDQEILQEESFSSGNHGF